MMIVALVYRIRIQILRSWSSVLKNPRHSQHYIIFPDMKRLRKTFLEEVSRDRLGHPPATLYDLSLIQ